MTFLLLPGNAEEKQKYSFLVKNVNALDTLVADWITHVK